MPAPTDTKHCPHCGQELSRVTMPDNSGWQEPYHLACFNDDCSYYENGWEWMYEHYRVKASYRYRLDPVSNAASPLPVWSSSAHRDRILVDDAIEDLPPAGPTPTGDRNDGVIPEEPSGNGGDQ